MGSNFFCFFSITKKDNIQNKVCFKKTGTDCSCDTVLQFVPVFFKQTLERKPQQSKVRPLAVTPLDGQNLSHAVDHQCSVPEGNQINE